MEFNTNGFTPQELSLTKAKVKSFNSRIRANEEAIEENKDAIEDLSEAVQDLIDREQVKETFTFGNTIDTTKEFILEGILVNSDDEDISAAPIHITHYENPNLPIPVLQNKTFLMFKLVNLSGAPLMAHYLSSNISNMVYYNFTGEQAGSEIFDIAPGYTGFAKITYL